jgi:hypothetical protein
MARFLKLTTMLLNTNDIHKIMINPTKYVIHIESKQIEGILHYSIWNGVGRQLSNVEELEVCETKNPLDYKMVSEWIDKTI